MSHVVVLSHIDHSGVQQIFGPYGTEELAAQALDELSAWPTLIGHWKVKPLTPAPNLAAQTTRQLPLAPGITGTTQVPVAWNPHFSCWTACAPAPALPTTYCLTWPLPPRPDGDPDAGVPARV